jgi:hypothetical protein
MCIFRLFAKGKFTLYKLPGIGLYRCGSDSHVRRSEVVERITCKVVEAEAILKFVR